MKSISQFQLYLLDYQLNELIDSIKSMDFELYKKVIWKDKWTVHEHLAHLGRYHEVFIERLNLILIGDNPELPRYVAKLDAAFTSWTNLSTNRIIEKTIILRKELRQLIEKNMNSLKSCSGRHPHFGSMTFLEWLHFFLLHESHHIYSIFRMIRSEASIKKN